MPGGESLHQGAPEGVLTREEVSGRLDFGVVEKTHLPFEHVHLERVEAGRYGRSVPDRDAERLRDAKHFSIQRGAHVANEVVLPHDRHDVDRRVEALDRLHRHLRNAGEERLYGIIRPPDGALGMEQDALAAAGPRDGIFLRVFAAVVRDEVVHSPELRRGGDDTTVRPTRHPRRNPGGDLLVDQPVRAELGVVRSDEGDRTGIDGGHERGSVDGRQVDRPQPEMAVYEGEVAHKRDASQYRHPEQQPPIDDAERPHEGGVGAGSAPAAHPAVRGRWRVASVLIGSWLHRCKHNRMDWKVSTLPISSGVVAGRSPRGQRGDVRRKMC